MLGHWGTSPGLSFIYLHLANALNLTAELETLSTGAVANSREHFEDPPEIRDWRWS